MVQHKQSIALRQLRTKRHWTQKDLADYLGVSRLTIGRWEHGDQVPERYHILQLCSLFNVDEHAFGFLPESEKTAQPPARTAIFDARIPLLPTIPLVGRNETLTRIKASLIAQKTIAITALNGLPGVGKTALATIIAHDEEMRAHFHDGILWLPLGPKPDIFAVFNRLGLLLGLPQQKMAQLHTIDDWSNAIRDEIQARSLLFIIDDAWHLQDTLPFCDVGPHCALLLTTRFPVIASQVAIHTTLNIEELALDESIELLRQLAPQVVEQEPERIRAIAHAVGGLPLALTLIGNYLRSVAYRSPNRRISNALDQLRDVQHRLALSHPNVPAETHPTIASKQIVSLQTILEVTDQHLSERARQTLYTLSVFPAKPDSFSEEAALSVAECTTAELDELLDAGFLESHGSERYRLHQIISDYAHLQLLASTRASTVRKRFFSYSLAYIQEHQKDYELLEQESRCLLSAIDLAAEAQQQQTFVQLVCAIAPFLLLRGFYQVAERYLAQAFEQVRDETQRMRVLLFQGSAAQRQSQHHLAKSRYMQGLQIARRRDHKESICDFLAALGTLYWNFGEFEQGERVLREALELANALHDSHRGSSIIKNLGAIVATRGDFRQAEALFTQGLDLARQSGDREELCIMLGNMATLIAERGEFQRGLDYFAEALQIARQIGDREQIALVLINMAHNTSKIDNDSLSEHYLEEAVRIAREIPHDEWLSVALGEFVLLMIKHKDYRRAEYYANEARETIKRITRRKIISVVLHYCGLLALEQGDIQRAEDFFTQMRETLIAEDHQTAAMVLFGMGRVAQARGNLTQARALGEQSRALLIETGFLADQKDVEQWLDTLNDQHE